jgi:hypothetical protein
MRGSNFQHLDMIVHSPTKPSSHNECQQYKPDINDRVIFNTRYYFYKTILDTASASLILWEDVEKYNLIWKFDSKNPISERPMKVDVMVLITTRM